MIKVCWVKVFNRNETSTMHLIKRFSDFFIPVGSISLLKRLYMQVVFIWHHVNQNYFLNQRYVHMLVHMIWTLASLISIPSRPKERIFGVNFWCNLFNKIWFQRSKIISWCKYVNEWTWEITQR